MTETDEQVLRLRSLALQSGIQIESSDRFIGSPENLGGYRLRRGNTILEGVNYSLKTFAEVEKALSPHFRKVTVTTRLSNGTVSD